MTEQLREVKKNYYGVIAQLGARIKNALNGIFYHKRRSFVSLQAREIEAQQMLQNE